jgi:predicted metal-binding membrane protein
MSDYLQPPQTDSHLSHWLWKDLNWVWVLVAIAWVLLFTIEHSHFQVVEHGHMTEPMSHSSMQGEAGWSTTVQTNLHFLANWQIMIVAMMLPSVLPVAKLFNQVSESASDRRSAQFFFILSYFTIWTAFALGLVAVSWFTPIVVHTITHLQHQLEWHVPSSQTLHGWTLVAVGLFQFTPMKRNCLKGCRSAAMVIAQYYQPGAMGGWRLGTQHGLYCLGCCWALMASMVVVGMGNLKFMLVLTAVMTLERVWKYGQRVATVTGVGLITWGGWLIA